MRKLNDVQLSIMAQSSLKEATILVLPRDSKDIDDRVLKVCKVQKELFEHTIKIVEDRLNL